MSWGNTPSGQPSAAPLGGAPLPWALGIEVGKAMYVHPCLSGSRQRDALGVSQIAMWALRAPQGAAEGRPLGVFPQDMRGVCKCDLN